MCEMAIWNLTPLRHHSTTVKDSFEFLYRLQNISIDNKIMGSFEVRSLFTNIPVYFKINLILQIIFLQIAWKILMD